MDKFCTHEPLWQARWKGNCLGAIFKCFAIKSNSPIELTCRGNIWKNNNNIIMENITANTESHKEVYISFLPMNNPSLKLKNK